MIPRVVSGAVLAALAFTSILYLPQTLFLLLLNLVLLFAFREFFQLLEGYHRRNQFDSRVDTETATPEGTSLSLGGTETRSDTIRESGRLGWMCLFLGLLLTWIWVFQSSWFTAYLFLAFLVLMTLSLTISDVEWRFPSAAGHVFGLCYLGFPVCLAVSYQQQPHELLLILLTVSVADIGAFLVGRRWGRHRLAPRISPKKSWEGFLGGMVLCVLFSLLYGSIFLPQKTPLFLGLLALLLGTVATMGDLFESAIKRGAGVKDSGSSIPGHGGLLDRMDGFLFALPTYYALSFLLE